jgi:tetratricopeptide (TPR) repeat protein
MKMGSLRPEFGRQSDKDSKTKEKNEKLVVPIDLSNDPEYIDLISLYQNGDFPKCREVLDALEERYPEHPALQKFEDDLQFKLMVRSMEDKNKKSEKREKVKSSFNVIFFVIIGVAIVVGVFFFSFRYFNNQIVERQQLQEAAQLESLTTQAEQLLLVGKPQPASAIVESIREIDPNYEQLSTLTSEVDSLLRMEAKYQEALALIDAGNSADALVLFYEIQEENPGLWDVSQQIAAIENENQLAILLENGNTAYQNEDWDTVISSYEGALVLSPQLSDPLITEQLLQGYLKKIISMLQADNATIEDIEEAEQYYRKAVALIPQSKEYANERENLQEASSNLLQLKFVQTAKAMLADSEQTITSVKKAVTYLSKAASIDPKNSALQRDVNNAEYYQVAFQDFLDMNWAAAITNLTKIMESDPNFAGGHSSTLLYEAYSALAGQYYSAGFYSDALNNYEQAELIAWDDTVDVLKLFQVQVNIGDTYGKLRDYENAVSYYLYALNSIDVPARTDLGTLNSLMAQASYWDAVGDFDSAYETLQEAFSEIDSVYTSSEIEIGDGVCLAFFADDNQSTVDAILEANNLPQNMVINYGRQLIVPSIRE